MPFKNGTYTHESGFTIYVRCGEIFFTSNAPLSMRLSELFDPKKWKEGCEWNGKNEG